MNNYGKQLKIVLASLIILGTIFWATDSIRSRSYSGTNFSFVVGRGAVTVTNPSTQPVPVQLTSTGSRSFSVLSTIEGVSGPSIKQGTGSSSQLVEFSLPFGVNEFTVVRGSTTASNVNFVASPPTRLDITAHPLNAAEFRTTLIVAAIIILVALFYISHVTNHRWINILRGKKISIDDTQPSFVVADGGQGAAARAYGDNRGIDIS